MKNRDAIVDQLGHVLMVAVRNSIAKGAVYNPNEDLTQQDPEQVWRGIADSIVNIVETAVKENKEIAP